MFDLKVGDEVRATNEATKSFGTSINSTSTATIKKIQFRPPSTPM